jgi:hypothetical protein
MMRKTAEIRALKNIAEKLWEKSGYYDRQTGTTPTNNAPRLVVASQVIKSLCLQTKKAGKNFAT